MLRLLADENFNGDIVRGLHRRRADVDLVRVQDMDLGGFDDPAVLAWAADHQRILLTHDRATIPDFAHQRVTRGELMAGVFILNDRYPVSAAIAEVAFLAECSDQQEWIGKVVWLPL